MSENMQLILAAYADADAATTDFERLVALIGAKEVRADGAVLVERDADGNVSVVDTGNRLGRKGAGWGGGVGILVGLAAPRCWRLSLSALPRVVSSAGSHSTGSRAASNRGWARNCNRAPRPS
jgi:hypothetical protein